MNSKLLAVKQKIINRVYLPLPRINI